MPRFDAAEAYDRTGRRLDLGVVWSGPEYVEVDGEQRRIKIRSYYIPGPEEPDSTAWIGGIWWRHDRWVATDPPREWPEATVSRDWVDEVRAKGAP